MRTDTSRIESGRRTTLPGFVSESTPGDVHVSPDVDLLQEMNRQAGWQAEYRQLESGALRTVSSLRVLGGLLILYEWSDRRLELAAEPPEKMVSVVVPLAPDKMVLNGCQMGVGSYAVLTQGAEVIAVTQQHAAAWSLQIDAESFSRTQRCLEPDRSPLDFGRFEVARNPPSSFARLQAVLESSRCFDATDISESELESEVVSTVIAGLATNAARSSRRNEAQSPHRAILRTAREYIEAHLAHRIRIPDVCLAAGTSLSTLEQAFRSELQMTSLAYIRVRRLDAVRRELMNPSRQHHTIARIATRYGFGHLGRFSQAYRQHFGRLPSQARTELPAQPV
jgi:AraC-like DNA-binding protein